MADQSKSTFARRIRVARPQDKRHDIRDEVIVGRGRAIHPSGVRSFFLSRVVHGRKRYATIGNADEITLPEARRKRNSPRSARRLRTAEQ